MTSILIRADSSLSLGSGHVMRCLTLAVELRERGAQVTFACRPLPGNWIERIRSEGFDVLILPVGAIPDADAPHAIDSPADAQALLDLLEHSKQAFDALVVDHYGLDASWELAMRGQSRSLLVMDDLADRPHECDLLLDSTLSADSDRYRTCVPRSCRQLLGPEFSLVRREFAARRNEPFSRITAGWRIVVSFGGSDPTRESLKALEAASILTLPDVTFDLVAGSHFPHLEAIREQCRMQPNVALHQDVADMAGLMAGADLFLGAGGGTTWERCCLGLPAVVVSVAPNQVVAAQALAEAGVQRYLGRSEQVSAQEIAQAIGDLLCDVSLRQQMSQRAQALVDGNGAARVAEALLAAI